MRLKKVVKTATATAVLTSMLAMPVCAAEWNTNGGSSTVVGDAYVVEPTIEVELPGDLTFGVNPLMLNVAEEGAADTSQIVSGNYLVTNYSNIPVAVSAVTTVTAGTDVQLMDTTSMVASAWDTTNDELEAVTGKKAVWLVQLYPKSVNKETGELTVTPITAGTTVAADVIGDTLTATAPTTTVNFVLAAYAEATPENSMSGFKFGGAVDPNATFVEGDLKVSTVFTLKTITENQKTNNYEAYETNGGKTLATTDVADTVKKEKP